MNGLLDMIVDRLDEPAMAELSRQSGAPREKLEAAVLAAQVNKIENLKRTISLVESYISTINVIVSFALVTVAGSYLTARFQNRNWRNQQSVQKSQDLKKKREEVFEEISMILDARLYRYRQIIYALRSKDEERIEMAFSGYKSILFDWNDKINRNYALIEIYFGRESRIKLEHKINRDIIWIGSILEKIKKRERTDVEATVEKINSVNGKLYNYYTDLLRIITTDPH